MAGPFLLVGGDSEIAVATAAHLRNLRIDFLATTRRQDEVAPDRPFLDLRLPPDEWPPLPDVRGACIFAAISGLLQCARDPIGASFINVTQTLLLIDRLLSGGTPVLFLSSDKVFDGSRPQVPAASPLCPASEYGRQKAETERALAQRMGAGAPITVLRLAKIVSPGMPLLKQWATALLSRAAIEVFADLVMAPTPVELVATAVANLLLEPESGIFQLSGPRDISYAEVGHYLARKLAAPSGLVVPVSAYAAGMPPGSTPANTTLDSSALRDRLDIAVPEPWAVIDELIPTCLA
jgi:dTDP-4-dehydrorhamnose reductase